MPSSASTFPSIALARIGILVLGAVTLVSCIMSPLIGLVLVVVNAILAVPAKGASRIMLIVFAVSGAVFGAVVFLVITPASYQLVNGS